MQHKIAIGMAREHVFLPAPPLYQETYTLFLVCVGTDDDEMILRLSRLNIAQYNHVTIQHLIDWGDLWVTGAHQSCLQVRQRA